MKIMVRVEDAESLRAGLDRKNEAGVTPVTIGVDAYDRAFLITMVGPYGEGEHVLFDSPWQGECDYEGAVEHCNECLGSYNTLSDLQFPVIVLDTLEDRK